jgi:cytochrome c biogenesis protein CcdA
MNRADMPRAATVAWAAGTAYRSARRRAKEASAMNQNTRTLIGAAIFFAVFVAFAWFLPNIMMAAVDISPWAAGLVAAVFLLGFFAVFWLRGRSRR